MTVTAVAAPLRYTGNGTTLAYSYTWKINAAADILAYVIDGSDSDAVPQLLTLNTHYAVSGAGDSAGGTVTLTAGAFAWIDSSNFFESSWVLVLKRRLALTQPTAIRSQGPFYRESFENALDRLAMEIQALQDQINLCPRLPETTNLSSFTTLMTVSAEAERLVGINAAGTAFTLLDSADLVNFSDALAIANNLSDLTSVATALTNLGIAPYTTWVSHSVTDGQADTDLTAQTFDGATYDSVIYAYKIKRGTTVVATGHLHLNYINSVWQDPEDMGSSREHGVTFTVSQVSATGQLKAALDVGAGNGTIKLSRRLIPA